MLEDLIKKLSDNFGYDYNKVEKESYKISITDDVQVIVTMLDEDLYFHSQIIKCPEEKKEQIYTYIMKANLLGQGTGRAAIGMDKDENFLTLSYLMSYEDNYTTFKEKIEDFVNYLIFWEDEVKKLQQQEKVL